MRKLLTILIFVSIMGISYHASAAVIDFQSVADGPRPGTTYGAVNGEYGAGSITFTAPGAPALTATGTYQDGTAFAYLDSGNAGLGVCQNLVSNRHGDNQCGPSSDDNVTYEELLTLTFETEVTFNDVNFVNGNHRNKFKGNFELFVDGVFVDTYSLTSTFAVDAVGTTFGFYNPNSGGGSNVSNDQQFYLSSISFNERSITPEVPVPASVWLMMSGLIGLVGIARRKA